MFLRNHPYKEWRWPFPGDFSTPAPKELRTGNWPLTTAFDH